MKKASYLAPVFLIGLVVIVLLVAAAGAFFLLSKTSKTETSVEVIEYNPTDSEDMVEKPMLSPRPFGKVYENAPFAKRQIDPQEEYFKENYPVEITKITDVDLQEIRCSPHFTGYDNENVYYYFNPKTQQNYSLSDNRVQKAIDAMKTYYKMDFSQAHQGLWICETKHRKEILLFETWYGAGNKKNGSYFAFLNKNGTITHITTIPDNGSSFFGCGKPMFLTKENMLYVICSGGDSGLLSSSIYKIDLDAKTNTQILKCESISDFETGKEKRACE